MNLHVCALVTIEISDSRKFPNFDRLLFDQRIIDTHPVCPYDIFLLYCLLHEILLECKPIYRDPLIMAKERRTKEGSGRPRKRQREDSGNTQVSEARLKKRVIQVYCCSDNRYEMYNDYSTERH